MRFLVFTHYAPLGAYGEVAVGGRRMSWARPGRSAVIGLVACALGIERAREGDHEMLERSLGYGVRTLVPGHPLMDYHTTQTPNTGRRGHRFATRREQLAWPVLATVLSSREYRTDAFFTVALWGRPESGTVLDAVGAALRRPAFCLFAGRKSAPLGLPPAPEMVETRTLPAAFAARGHNDVERDVLRTLGWDDEASTMIACDLDAPGLPGEVREERRRDAVTSRARWQFSDRDEAVFPWPAGGA